jgi:chaperonin GroEL
MKAKKACADDALRAVHAAMEEGVVPGGGVALLRSRLAVQGVVGENEDQAAGIRIVLRALEEPLRQIAANAGAHPPVVMNAVLNGDADFGFDAATGEFTDLLVRGIIDPAKVVCAALQNAASVAGLLLTTSCAVAELVAHADSDGANELPGDGR